VKKREARRLVSARLLTAETGGGQKIWHIWFPNFKFGPCEEIDLYHRPYYVTKPDIPLSLEVNNKQNIYNGIDDPPATDDRFHIRMLDRNEAIPWTTSGRYGTTRYSTARTAIASVVIARLTT